MDPQLKERWIEALESGKYEQGRNVLRDKDNKFCCLGVLCDVMKPNGWVMGINDYYWHSGILNRLPVEIQNVTGLSDLGHFQHPVLLEDNTEWVTLAGLNDHGMPFKEIAQVIREQF